MASGAQRESWFRVLFDLGLTTFFLVAVGSLFVAFAILLGKLELLVLAYVLLLAACARSLLPAKWKKKLEKVAVVGEGVRIFNRLEGYYLHGKPRSFLFYLLFPLTGIWLFFFGGEQGRRELKAYFGLLQWIGLLLFVEGAASYVRFYQHFDWSFALRWLYLELLCVYFLCNFFAVPITTTSLRLSLSEKQKRLFLSTFLALGVLSGVFAYFTWGADYKSLIPINIMMGERTRALRAHTENKKAKPTKPGQQQDMADTDADELFFLQLQGAAQMFLRHHGARIAAFHQRYFLKHNAANHEKFGRRLNKLFQEHLTGVAVFGEEKHIYLTLTGGRREFWALVCMPFRESLYFLFHYEEGRLRLYRRWAELPSKERSMLPDRWDTSKFHPTTRKRFMRMVTDVLGRFFRQEAPPARQQSMAIARPEPAFGVVRGFRQRPIKDVAEELERLQRRLEVIWPKLRRSWNAFVKRTNKEIGLEIRGKDLESLRDFWRVWGSEWDVLGGQSLRNETRFLSTIIPKIRSSLETVARMQERFEQLRKKHKKARGRRRVSRPSDWARELRMRRAREAILARQKRSLYAVQRWLARMEAFGPALERFSASLFGFQWPRIKRQREVFVVHAGALKEFDYRRALRAKLLLDHFGKVTKLAETWWTKLYSSFLWFVLLLLQVSMPFHMLVIIYAQVTVAGEAADKMKKDDDDDKEKDKEGEEGEGGEGGEEDEGLDGDEEVGGLGSEGGSEGYEGDGSWIDDLDWG